MNAPARLASLSMLLVLGAPGAAEARELRVGAAEAYATVGEALDDAADGDVVVVTAGTYRGSLTTRADGVILRGEGEAILAADGRVLRVGHDRITLEGLILDGEYGDGDALQVRGDEFTMRGGEVRRAGRDCIDIGGAVRQARIEDAEIHHCLRVNRDGCDAPGCRVDAHGIVADQVQGLEVLRTRIHTFSGDAIQLDGRDSATMWQGDVLRAR